MSDGRPLRFLAGVVGGWVLLRTAMLWPVAVSAVAVPVAGPVSPPRTFAAAASSPVAPPITQRVVARATPSPMRVAAPSSPIPVTPPPLAQPITFPPVIETPPSIPPPLAPTPIATRPGRWSGSLWGIARDGRGGSLSGSQLGGSQAGVRIAYAVDDARRLALTARASTPLHSKGREIAFGLAWQPTRAPVQLFAEQRVSLDGGRGRPTLGVIGGAGPVPLPADFRLEAYGQAGGIARDAVEGFADGAARIARPLAQIGKLRLDIGAGAWGGVQRGASRLDIGPTVGLTAPVAGRDIRLTLDWRARIAGNARPGSGPALSIGSDF